MTKTLLILVGGEPYETYDRVAGVFDTDDQAISYVVKHRDELRCNDGYDDQFDAWYLAHAVMNPVEFINPLQDSIWKTSDIFSLR